MRKVAAALGLALFAARGIVVAGADGASQDPVPVDVQLTTPCTAPTFSAPVLYTTGAGPREVTTGDFNGDGRRDIVTADGVDRAVSVLINIGGGIFAQAARVPAGLPAEHVLVADFNRDGHDDIAVAGEDNTIDPETLAVLFGAGDGTFPQRFGLRAGRSPAGMAAGDFTGDGLIDLAVANALLVTNPSTVSIVPGNGAGAFGTPIPLQSGFDPRAIAAADFNGDGRLDLVVASQPTLSTGTIEYRRANSSGGFLPFVRLDGASLPDRLTPVDLNGDGLLDLATSSSNTANVFFGPLGSSLPTSIALSGPLNSIDTADFNADGRADLAFASFAAGHAAAAVALGDGAGHLGTLKKFAAGGIGSVGYDLSAADFDGDGLPDLALVNGNNTEPTLAIFRNMCGVVADLSVTMSDSEDPFRRGGQLTYTITVVNNGPDEATDVFLQTGPPAGANIVSVTPGAGVCAIDPNTGRITCALGTIAAGPPGNQVTVSLVVSPALWGLVTAQSVVAAPGVDLNPTNNVASQSTLVTEVGAFDVRIIDNAGGASLRWTPGNLEAGYFIGRLANSTTNTFGPFPPTPGSFGDPSPVPGTLNWYVVNPVDAAGATLGRSKMLGLLPGIASPSGAPAGFSLTMRGSIADLSWSTATQQTAFAVIAHPQGGAPTTTYVAGILSSVSLDTGGIATCYVLARLDGSTPLGNSNGLCTAPPFGGR